MHVQDRESSEKEVHLRVIRLKKSALLDLFQSDPHNRILDMVDNGICM